MENNGKMPGKELSQTTGGEDGSGQEVSQEDVKEEKDETCSKKKKVADPVDETVAKIPRKRKRTSEKRINKQRCKCDGKRQRLLSKARIKHYDRETSKDHQVGLLDGDGGDNDHSSSSNSDEDYQELSASDDESEEEKDTDEEIEDASLFYMSFKIKFFGKNAAEEIRKRREKKRDENSTK